MTCHVTVFFFVKYVANARERSQGRSLILHVLVYFVLALKLADYFQTVLHYLNLIH